MADTAELVEAICAMIKVSADPEIPERGTLDGSVRPNARGASGRGRLGP